MWKHLLVPLDFSECARHALDLAAALTAYEGASVTLMHVTPLPPNLSLDALVTPPNETHTVPIGEYTTRASRERLQSIAAPLHARGLDVRTIARATSSGDVAEEVLRAARELDVDVIVMGTHGRSGLAHLLLGSVAEKVIRRAPVPVITLRTASAEAELTPEEHVVEDELAG